MSAGSLRSTLGIARPFYQIHESTYETCSVLYEFPQHGNGMQNPTISFTVLPPAVQDAPGAPLKLDARFPHRIFDPSLIQRVQDNQ